MRTIVVDNGSDTMKAGFGGQQIPHAEFPTKIGTSRPPRYRTDGIQDDQYWVGKKGFSTKHPIQLGEIVDWDGMEKIWDHTFSKELMVAPEDHPILMTEGPLNPPPNREKMTQMMFEVFKTPSFCLAKQAVLALYASGRDTGLVLDSGGGITHTVPIFKGRAIQNATLPLNVGGLQLSEFLTRMIWEAGYSLVTISSEEDPDVREMKETICHVSLDLNRDIQYPHPTDQILILDGSELVDIAKDSFRCPELLFKPDLLGIEQIGIHQMIVKSISSCGVDLGKDLYKNITLSGGSTLFPGLPERLKKELAVLVPEMEIEITLPPEPQRSAWLGGSLVSSSPTFQDISISKQDYEEVGASIVHRKCP